MKMKQGFLFLCCSAVISAYSFSPMTFTKQFATVKDVVGVSSINAQAVLFDEANSRVYIAGQTSASIDSQTYVNDGYADNFLSCHLMNGTRLWTRMFGGPNNQDVNAIKQVPVTGDLIVLGRTQGNFQGKAYLGGNGDFYVVRCLSNGTMVYAILGGTVNYEIAFDGLIDVASQQIIMSGSYNGQGGIYRAYISNGTFASLTLGAFPGDGSIVKLAATNQTGYYIATGYTFTVLDSAPIIGGGDIYVSMLNVYNGSRLWTRIYGDSAWDYGTGAAYDATNDLVYVNGMSTNASSTTTLGGQDAFLICLQGNGTLLWTRLFGTSGDDQSLTMFVHTPSSMPIVGGFFIGSYPGKVNGGLDGFVASFFPNGTMSQILFGQQSGSTRVSQISVGSVSNSQAFIADGYGWFWSLSMTMPTVTTTTTTTTTTPATSTALSSSFVTSSTLIMTTTSALSSAPVASSSVAATSTSSGISSLVSSTLVATSTPIGTTPYVSSTVVATSTSSTVVLTPSASLSSTVLTTSVGSSPLSSTFESVSSTPAVILSFVPTASQEFTSSSVFTTPVSANNVPSLVLSPSTLSDQNNQGNNDNINNQGQIADSTNLTGPNLLSGGNITIIGAAAGGLLVIGLAVGLLVLRRRIQVAKQSQTVSETTTSSAYDGTSATTMSSIVAGGTSIMTTNMQTLVRPNYELSMPGYLRFTSGLDFVPVNQIAKGGGGTIYVGRGVTKGLNEYGGDLIVKVVGDSMETSLFDFPEKLHKQFNQEVSLMHFFRNEKYIAKLLGWCELPAAILMKNYTQGSLHGFLKKNRDTLQKSTALQFIQDISLGLQLMHRAGFVHCDLKPQNVLIDEDFQTGRLFCVLTDFGITQIVDETTLLVKDFKVVSTRGLSVSYAAPEVFQRFRRLSGSGPVMGEIVMKADIYSFAVVIFEIMLRRSPWS